MHVINSCKTTCDPIVHNPHSILRTARGSTKVAYTGTSSLVSLCVHHIHTHHRRSGVKAIPKVIKAAKKTPTHLASCREMSFGTPHVPNRYKVQINAVFML